MNMRNIHFTGRCFLSLILALFAGSVRADQLWDLPPPRASQSFTYLLEETIPIYDEIPEQPDIAAQTEVLPKMEGVAGNVVVVRDLPVADKEADLIFQAPRSHIQGELFQMQDEEEGGTIRPRIPQVEEPPETQTPSEIDAAGDYVRQWTAVSNSGWIPPDTIHAVGPNHIVEAVNSGFAIYTKLGTELQGYTTFDSFMHKPSGWQGYMYDPRVIYDWDHDKFVMLVLGKDDTNLESYFWLAVSQTSDPTGGWWRWRFRATDFGGSSTAWLDYAGLGADRWGVYVTGNYFYFSGGFRGSNLWTINPDIFNGGATNGWQWVDLTWPSGADAFALQPAHPHTVNSNQETYLVNTYSGSGNKVLLWKLSGSRFPPNSVYLTRTEIDISAYNAIGENVDQPDSTVDIDGGDARVMNAVYTNRRVFFTLTNDWNDDANACGWQTVKLNSDANTKEWEHFLWGGDGLYYFYPAVTLEGTSTSGNLAVFGSWTMTSGGSQYASGLYKIYTGQPNNADGPFTNMVSGLAAYVSLDRNGRNRWGDYSGAGYDWECLHAWGAVESADTGNRWRTTIGARVFDNEPPCTLIEVTVPNGGEIWSSGTTHTITWKRANLPATDDVYVFFNDGSTSTQIAGPLSPTSSSYSWVVLEKPTNQGKIFVGSWNGSAYTVQDWSDDYFTVLDETPPNPNPMTWATEPYEINTSQIRMTATTATDPSASINYYFNYYSSPTGGTGGSSSGWIASTTYTDSGLLANHQYSYRIKARDGYSNETAYSGISYEFTDIETPSGITFGTTTSSSIEVRSTNTPSGLTRSSSGLIIYNYTTGANSGWKQNNNYWTSSSLSPNTNYGFRAKARNGDASETAYSDVAYRYTHANVPGASAFSSVTETSIRANWSANGNPAGTLYLCENTTTGANSGWTSDTTWNNTGLTCNTSYAYRVKARNGNAVETAWRSLGTQLTLPCTGGVTVVLNPHATTVPRGGTLRYSVTVTNTSASSKTFQYWTNVTLPNGNKYPPSGQLYGPRTVTLGPGVSKSGTLSHKIPANVKLGTYTYNAFVGPYPTVWDEDHFDFTITLPPSSEPATDGGTQTWETRTDRDFQ